MLPKESFEIIAAGMARPKPISCMVKPFGPSCRTKRNFSNAVNQGVAGQKPRPKATLRKTAHSRYQPDNAANNSNDRSDFKLHPVSAGKIQHIFKQTESCKKRAPNRSARPILPKSRQPPRTSPATMRRKKNKSNGANSRPLTIVGQRTHSRHRCTGRGASRSGAGAASGAGEGGTTGGAGVLLLLRGGAGTGTTTGSGSAERPPAQSQWFGRSNRFGFHRCLHRFGRQNGFFHSRLRQFRLFLGSQHLRYCQRHFRHRSRRFCVLNRLGNCRRLCNRQFGRSRYDGWMFRFQRLNRREKKLLTGGTL